MYLKSLSIKGFKSFAKKTVLEFEPGVTVIVGPNGSGKSNIADAIMWVLGEQSPTSLRGNRMEDVIFSGSDTAKPVNLAEVVLTLDNSSGFYGSEYSEITIVRNAVRGGENEYRLNGNTCRLLDIQELLSDSGVGRTLNSVILQGNLDEVLTCRPEERRDYIEEAAGLLKYRRRREKAVRRLARMEEDLTRTNDIIREVRRQLRPLKLQASRLEKYQELVRELSECQLRLDVARLRGLQKEWEAHRSEQEERERQITLFEFESGQKLASMKALEEKEAAWRSREATLRDELYRLVSVHERLKAMLTVWGEKGRRSTLVVSAPGPEEIAEVKALIAGAEDRKSELDSEHSELRQREAELLKSSSDETLELSAASRSLAALQARKEVIFSAQKGLGTSGLKILEEKRKLLGTLEADQLVLTEGPPRCEKRLAASRARLEEQQALYEGIETEAGRASDRLLGLEQERSRLGATLETLNDLEAPDWSELSTAALLRENDPTGGGLGGLLAEELTVQEPHQRAVLGYLGPWAFGLAARDADTITDAIAHLKETGLGQSIFFSAPGNGRVAASAQPAPPGTVRAREVVAAPVHFDDALDLLLRNVYLAQGIREAMALSAEYPRLIFVSPDGDYVSGGALVRGGSENANPVYIQATARAEAVRKEIDLFAARILKARDELEEIERKKLEMHNRLEAVRLEVEDSEAQMAVSVQKLEDCQRRTASTKADIDRMVATEEEGERKGEEARELDNEIRIASEKVRAIRGRVDLLEVERRDVANRIATVNANLSSAARELETAISREREIQKTLEAVERDRQETEFQAAAGEVIRRLAGLNRKLVGLVAGAREKVKAELEAGVAVANEESASLSVLRQEVSRLQLDQEKVRDYIHREDVKRAELKVVVEQLVERIVDERKVALEVAFRKYPEEELTGELESRVERLTATIESVGPINQEAITERELLEERFAFLNGQLEDIDKTRAQLKQVIREIDSEIKEGFLLTLREVDGHFREMFSTLFPNGKAELSMTDPDDPLASGIEIFAQPEGKKLRRISLLSGGEKSLTALAFFFALFKVRPSPFYFMDEVEAALDDPNLNRFLDIVNKFRGDSQLVLITHQKKSMEIADVLYGVTMQDGISSVVSRRLEEDPS